MRAVVLPDVWLHCVLILEVVLLQCWSNDYMLVLVVCVQECSNTMRLITNDLFQLEDKMGIVAACTLLPDLDIPLSTS